MLRENYSKLLKITLRNPENWENAEIISLDPQQENFDFEVWAIAVKKQMLDALSKKN